MRTKLSVAAALAAGLLALTLASRAIAQEQEPPGEGCVLLETRSFSEDQAREARDYANSNSGDTGGTFNGQRVVQRSTVRVVRGSLGNRVIVVKIWLCPQAAANGGGNAGGNNGGVNGGGGGRRPDPPRGPDVPTYDPRFYEYRDGRLIPRPNAPNRGGGATGGDDHSGCDRPDRFECGQHYLWWLQNHQHRPSGSGQRGQKKEKESVPRQNSSDLPAEIVPMDLKGSGTKGCEGSSRVDAPKVQEPKQDGIRAQEIEELQKKLQEEQQRKEALEAIEKQTQEAAKEAIRNLR